MDVHPGRLASDKRTPAAAVVTLTGGTAGQGCLACYSIGNYRPLQPVVCLCLERAGMAGATQREHHPTTGGENQLG